jgi:hypothetical protein
MLDNYDGLRELSIYCGIIASVIFLYLIIDGSK